MNCSRTLSATALLYNLVGDEMDTADEWSEFPGLPRSDDKYLRPISDEDEEVFRVLDDRVPLRIGENGKPQGRFIPKVAGKFMFSTSNNFECSVCMTPFHEVEETYTLPCGHKYCKGCVASYIHFYAGENLPLQHKVSLASLDDNMLTVNIVEMIGVPCPNKSCQKIFSHANFPEVLEEKELERFDELFEAKLRRERDAIFRLNQIRADNLLASWSLARKDIVRLCPHCYTQIEKNGGCENMNCATCGKHFIWPNALKVGSRKHWLGEVINPSAHQINKARRK